jgi:preprotein translocase SecE subunit
LKQAFKFGRAQALATKVKKSATKKEASATKVTRITASDDTAKPVKKETKEKAVAPIKGTEKTSRRNPAVAIREYFVGAWYELRQVRWPNRRATWGMTMAVLAFTVFFVVLILLLDALFKYLFQLILG